MTISEAIERYVQRKRPDWSGGTERTYRRNLELFVDYTAGREIESLSELTRWNVGAFTDYLLAQDYAKASVASRQKSIKTWLKWLEGQGLLEPGVHLAIETLKLTDDEESSDEQLDPEAARTLLAFYRDSSKWRGTRGHAILEVLWHTGCRASGLIALDLGDFDGDAGDLMFRNRPETDTRLKRGDQHQRNVTISETPTDVLRLWCARERPSVRDDHGREPLFPSEDGRPTVDTVRYWVYEATQPCMAEECPHGKRRPNCEWVPRNEASKCPSTRSPHPVRRGSITWQRNLGFSAETVAERAAATPGTIRRYYDDPDYEDELERRRSQTEDIDITAHLHPDDLEVQES